MNKRTFYKTLDFFTDSGEHIKRFMVNSDYMPTLSQMFLSDCENYVDFTTYPEKELVLFSTDNAPLENVVVYKWVYDDIGNCDSIIISDYPNNTYITYSRKGVI